MNIPRVGEHTPDGRRASSIYPLLIIASSLIAIVATFLLANSSVDVASKTRGFSAIIAAFLIVCVGLHLWQSRRKSDAALSLPGCDADVERHLFVLDEATEFFAGSLNSADTFRLAASRVKELMPCKTITLFLLDEKRSHLKVAVAEGYATSDQKGRTVGLGEDLAGKCYLSRCVEFESEPAGKVASSVAVPLCHDLEVFGVLQLHFDETCDPHSIDPSLFEAVGTRVAPLMLGSIAFERSQANALTDLTTDLPNERAFYLILENQIAEAQRKGNDRPLTILAFDIQNFDEVNQRFGHAAGDRVLSFVAQVVKDNLRQMDFFARSIGDEFLAILPTASKEISPDVIARIHAGLFGRKLKISDSESIEIDLNFGWATFGNDGETPDGLLSVARVRKEQAKSSAPNKILWFPQEFAN